MIYTIYKHYPSFNYFFLGTYTSIKEFKSYTYTEWKWIFNSPANSSEFIGLTFVASNSLSSVI